MVPGSEFWSLCFWKPHSFHFNYSSFRGAGVNPGAPKCGPGGQQNHVCVSNPLWLFATPWTVAHQVPLSKKFPRQEYWSELPCPPPRALPDPGIKLMSLMSPALVGGFFTTRATWGTSVKPWGQHKTACWSILFPQSFENNSKNQNIIFLT